MYAIHCWNSKKSFCKRTIINIRLLRIRLFVLFLHLKFYQKTMTRSNTCVDFRWFCFYCFRQKLVSIAELYRFLMINNTSKKSFNLKWKTICAPSFEYQTSFELLLFWVARMSIEQRLPSKYSLRNSSSQKIEILHTKQRVL